MSLPRYSSENAPQISEEHFEAVRTGLEPATPGVTGRCSNQLNYRTILGCMCVFVERGCKGKHFFLLSKFFFNFFVIFCWNTNVHSPIFPKMAIFAFQH